MSSSAQGPVPRRATEVEHFLVPADAALGLVALAGHVSRRMVRRLAPAARPVVHLVVRPPVVPTRWQGPEVVSSLRTRGGQVRQELTTAAGAVLDRLVPTVLDQVLRRVDVTQVVVTRVDLDAVAAQLDIAAVLDRVDLAGIAMQVIDAVDLPEVIRGSSGAMASDTVLGARLRGIAGDQAIGRVRDRFLSHRDRHHAEPAASITPDTDTAPTFPVVEHP